MRVLAWDATDDELLDEARTQAWIEAGAPPLAEWDTSALPTEVVRPRRKPQRDPKAAPDAPPLHLRVAVTKAEAGALLGKSEDWIEDHVIAEVRTIRRGAAVLILVRDLEAWAERSAAMALKRRRAR